MWPVLTFVFWHVLCPVFTSSLTAWLLSKPCGAVAALTFSILCFDLVNAVL